MPEHTYSDTYRIEELERRVERLEDWREELDRILLALRSAEAQASENK
jgi:hypothetical protein